MNLMNLMILMNLGIQKKTRHKHVQQRKNVSSARKAQQGSHGFVCTSVALCEALFVFGKQIAPRCAHFIHLHAIFQYVSYVCNVYVIYVLCIYFIHFHTVSMISPFLALDESARDLQIWFLNAWCSKAFAESDAEGDANHRWFHHMSMRHNCPEKYSLLSEANGFPNGFLNWISQCLRFLDFFVPLKSIVRGSTGQGEASGSAMPL